MTAAARERLADLLGGVKGQGAFSTRRTMPVDDLSIEVRDVGALLFPVPQAQAKQLIALARPVCYGRGERTLLDRRLRDTWEVPLSRVTIDKRRWHRALRAVLDQLRGDLGMPDGCELKAELHSMLVYGPGQFFVPHQDSEKDDAMIGSLVVTLPSTFTGGDLVVEHGRETKTYRGSKNALSLVAFYADCHHQIRPVRSGYRIVLTYNLVLRGETTPEASGSMEAATVEAATACIEEHFATRHTGTRRSGRVGRSSAGRALNPEAVTLAVVAAVRHGETPYDQLLMSGVPRSSLESGCDPKSTPFSTLGGRPQSHADAPPSLVRCGHEWPSAGAWQG